MSRLFYNQRYTINRTGVQVRLRGYPFLHSLTLKVRRGLHDPSFYDFLGLFENQHGQFDLHVLDGSVISGEAIGISHIYGYLADNYYNHVMAEVYHDLVTAPEVKIGDVPEDQGTRQSALTNLPRRTYIPRWHKGRSVAPRHPLAKPLVSEPHHVPGHKRRGNMTDRHREEIKRFEEEYEIQVFSWLPPGHTYVRPHLSPKITGKEFKRLPRFIRVRVQEDIRRALSEPDDSPAS